MTRRPVLLALAMTAFFVVFEAAALGTPYRRYLLLTLLEIDLWAVVRVAGLFAIAGVQMLFFWVSFAASPRWRVLHWLIFTLIVFTEYGYVRATGGFINGHDFRIAAGELPRWRHMIALHLTALGVIPSLVFAALLAAAGRPRPGNDLRRFAAATVLAVALHSVYAAALYARSDEDVGLRIELAPPAVSTQAFVRSATMFAWSRCARLYFHFRYGGRSPVAFRAVSPPPRHVVLVVDESVRGDHLSVNGYARKTTPWLDALQASGRLTNWGIAASATPTSNDSVICMLTGVYTLPDGQHRTGTQPMLFQLAKAMRYETHLFDGGSRQLRFGFEYSDLRAIDDWGTRDHFGNDVDTDLRIGREIARLLERGPSQFIVVLKRGSHVPYGDNYPPAQSVWVPDDPHSTDADPDDDRIINTYDNSLRYNVDSFFQAIFGARAGLERTVMLYTSDHGQILTDTRGYGLSREVAWGEAAVPMLMLGGARPAGLDAGYRAGHGNVMPTLLDLMEVPASVRTAGLMRSLISARASDVDPRRVFAGAFFGMGAFFVQDFDELDRPH